MEPRVYTLEPDLTLQCGSEAETYVGMLLDIFAGPLDLILKRRLHAARTCFLKTPSQLQLQLYAAFLSQPYQACRLVSTEVSREDVAVSTDQPV